MPLVYCNCGSRDYGAKPIALNTRGYWEFQFTLSGKNRMLRVGKSMGEDDADDNFWISTPESTHGWTSSGKDPSKIAVFHFSEVPKTLSGIFKGRTTLSTRVDPDVLVRVAGIANAMIPLLYSPTYTSSLEFELCCGELSLLFLRNSEALLEKMPWDNRDQIVRSAIAWYCEHIGEGVGIQETAERVGYSVSQLRKLFMKARGTGPNKVFEECRMNRARELLQFGSLSVIEISLECGYNNQSSFSRAFRHYHGVSPLEFRKASALRTGVPPAAGNE